MGDGLREHNTQSQTTTYQPMSAQTTRATIGVDFSLKLLTWSQNLQLRLELWDLAGQDRCNAGRWFG